MLLRKGIPRHIVDELEILSETGTYAIKELRCTAKCLADENMDALLGRLEKIAPTLVQLLTPYVQEIQNTIRFANAAGVSRPILFNPLMMSNRNPYFKDGVCFEVVRRTKHSDILAAGGR